MFTDAVTDSDFLCVVQGIIDFGKYAKRGIFVDFWFVRNGSVFHITNIDGGHNVVATTFAIGANQNKSKYKRYRRIYGARNEMVTAYIYGNVRMDAGGFGVVLDGFEFIRNTSNIHN